MGGVGLLRVAWGSGRIEVTVVAAGMRRAVMVNEPATVATALRTALVEPRSGRLVSVVTRKVLAPASTPAGVENILGHQPPRDVWEVNVKKDYHEERTT